jgi:hypothetical protein
MKARIAIRRRLAAALLTLAAWTAACAPAPAANYPVVNVTFYVTEGAGLGVFSKKGGEGLSAVHFEPFTKYTFTKKSEPSGGYDVYTGSLPSVEEFHYETGGGDTGLLKQAQKFSLAGDATKASVSIDLTPLDLNRREDNGHKGDDIYFNVNDAQHLVMKEGEVFNLLPIRVWQAMSGESGNYFIEPDCHVEAQGDGAVSYSHEGSPGLKYVKLMAKRPGTSVLKVTYDPVLLAKRRTTDSITSAGYKYQEGDKDTYYNAIEPANTGIVVVTVVAGDGYDAENIVTNAGMREYDTFYFDSDKAEHAEYTFKPSADSGGITVRAHRPLHEEGVMWGGGWSDGRQNPDGSFTVNLFHGRNIIEVGAGAQGFKRYHVVTAKGIGITVKNKLNAGWGVGDALAEGDEIEISFTGIKTPLEKIAGKYNPGFPDSCYVLYDTQGGEQVRSAGTQYNLSVPDKNKLSVTVPASRRIDLVNGAINCGGYGSSPGGHRITVGDSVTSPNAGGANAPNVNTALYSIMPDITLGGMPMAPSGAIAAEGDAEITLHWDAPLWDGGGAITGYEVSNGGEDWDSLPAGVRAHTFEGLENAIEYTLYVRAVNAAGAGTYASVNAAPYEAGATAPGVPGGFTVTTGNHSAALAWDAPDNGGALITEYQVSIDGVNWTDVPAPALAYTFEGLTDGTYTFRVRAVNVRGAGEQATRAATVSSPAASLTPPGKPEGFTVTAGNGEALLSWKAPLSDGGSEVIKYQATKGDSVWVDVSAGAYEHKFAGLTNSVGYTFGVRAVNMLGPGEAASAAATPLAGGGESPEEDEEDEDQQQAPDDTDVNRQPGGDAGAVEIPDFTPSGAGVEAAASVTAFESEGGLPLAALAGVTAVRDGAVVADTGSVMDGLGEDKDALDLENYDALPLLVFEAEVSETGNTAVVMFSPDLDRFDGANAGDVAYIKLLPDGRSELLSPAPSLKGIADGQYAIADGRGRKLSAGDAILAGGDYRVYVAIADGGRYDFDGAEDGRVVDPGALSVRKSAAGGVSGGGGCDSGAARCLVTLVSAAALCLRGRRAERDTFI